MEEFNILFVDDEPNILNSLKRLFFADNDINVHTALTAREGAQILKSESIDLVVSDERMPKIKGSEFVHFIKRKYPDTLRIILTGFAEMTSIMAAVNKGEVYRYLIKPWNDNELKMTIRKALEHSYILKKNKEMQEMINIRNDELNHLNADLEFKIKERTIQLEKSLNSLKSVVELNSGMFRHLVFFIVELVFNYQKELGRHLRRTGKIAELLCPELKLEQKKKDNIIFAAYLHDIGLMNCRNELLVTEFNKLQEEDKNFYYKHPEKAGKLLGNKDGLEEIINIIHYHHEENNGKGFPDKLCGHQIPLGSRLIKVISDYDDLIRKSGKNSDEALTIISRNENNTYDHGMVKIFCDIISVENLSAKCI